MEVIVFSPATWNLLASDLYISTGTIFIPLAYISSATSSTVSIFFSFAVASLPKLSISFILAFIAGNPLTIKSASKSSAL